MADDKIRGYAFPAQAFEVFKLGCFQAVGVADKLTDFVSPSEFFYRPPAW
jgi:hypothetical protein